MFLVTVKPKVSCSILQSNEINTVAIYADSLNVRIMSYAGPFKGVALGTVISCLGEANENVVSNATIKTAKFWYSDMTNWVMGHSDTIKYYWATAEVNLVRSGNEILVGFSIKDLSGNVLYSFAPTHIQTGYATVSL